jgi:thiamine biosynthesis protein ThiS
MKDFSGWAIALNEEVVPFDEIKEKSLNEGDRLILVQATQGG